MAYRLGVDVGGTFTDLLLFEESTGASWLDRTLIAIKEAADERSELTDDHLAAMIGNEREGVSIPAPRQRNVQLNWRRSSSNADNHGALD